MFGGRRPKASNEEAMRQRRRMAGSSPRCAENSRCPSRLAPVTAVHPRVARGTHVVASHDRVGLWFTPAGRGECSLSPVEVSRFIPTCVGNARCRPARSQGRAAHPRCAGNASSFPIAALCQLFTPAMRGGTRIDLQRSVHPRVRGKLSTISQVGELFRFIPACAGNA